MSGAPYSVATFKRSVVHFLSGKAVSALLTFLTLLWLVRLLPISEYAVYVTLVALLELTLAIASAGLPWVAARYVPDFRLHAPLDRLIRFVVRLLAWHAVLLAGFTLFLFFALDVGLAGLGLLQYRDAASLYLAMLLVDGIGRIVRETLLATLMQQRMTQVSLVLRNAAFISMLGGFAIAGDVDLQRTVLAELSAALLGTLTALFGLYRYLRSIPEQEGAAEWREPETRTMLVVARQMYISHLLSLIYSPQIFLVMISARLGAEATALFGFLRSLYAQVSRYLPAMLLFNVIRPMIVSAFVRTGDVRELTGTANLAGKLSLFVLMPLVVVSAVAGDDLIAILSGGKFADAGMFFFGLTIALIPLSQLQLLQSVAVASGHGDLCLRASTSGVLMLPLMYGLLEAGAGLWAPIIALGLGQMIFNGIILAGLSRRIGFAADLRGLAKLFVAAAGAYLGAFWLSPIAAVGVHLAIGALLAGGIYLAIAWLVKPFSGVERNLLNRFLGRRLFVW